MGVDDYGLLAQVIPVFLLVVMLEGVFSTSESAAESPGGASRFFDRWTILYRAYLITALSAAEFYSVLRAMARLPASSALDTATLNVLSSAVTVLLLVTIGQHVRRYLWRWHLGAAGIGLIGAVAITWMLIVAT